MKPFLDPAAREDESPQPVPWQQAGCEFCDELRHAESSRFRGLYPDVRSRVVLEGPQLVAMPTLGQLFKGSMLVLPREHVEAAARMSESQLCELETCVGELERQLADLGNCVVFEHGAICASGAGCGIYHAHVHVVPLPGEASCQAVLGGEIQFADGFACALRGLRSASSYLIFRDTGGLTAYRDLSLADLSSFPSQYLRRRLGDHFHIERSWDWRRYDRPEPYLVEALRHFRGWHN
jgi:diadenosine tetraphosphate (Ap4A) HIT family hydrolase